MGANSPVARELKTEWVKNQELFSQLKRYAKITFFLLVILTIFVFLWELAREHPRSNSLPQARLARLMFESKQAIPTELLLLLLVLGLVIFLWDLFERKRSSLRSETGLSDASQVIAIRGSDYLPGKQYSSESLGLSSKPDALILEDGFIIPIDRRPMATQVRDRHVVQLLVHLRLIEELEGQRPPHGILLLGRDVQKKIIKNSEEKQRWLENLIDEMRSIIDGVPTVPSPKPQKCKNCDVRKLCQFSVARQKS